MEVMEETHLRHRLQSFEKDLDTYMKDAETAFRLQEEQQVLTILLLVMVLVLILVENFKFQQGFPNS